MSVRTVSMGKVHRIGVCRSSRCRPVSWWGRCPGIRAQVGPCAGKGIVEKRWTVLGLEARVENRNASRRSVLLGMKTVMMFRTAMFAVTDCS